MAHSTQSVPTLAADDVMTALGKLRSRQPVKFAAFYSSQLGGIVTDPALMVIPFDDHMVHRGHGIFDTAGLVGGKIYDLEAHLDRFLRSAEHSRLVMPYTRAQLRDIIITTVAASQQRDGAIRYWLSSGPGNLELSPAAGAEPGFFVMVFPGLSYPDRWYTGRAQGDDHHVSHQALAVRGDQEHELPAQRADADGGQGRRRGQRRVHRRQRPRGRELEHERGLRDRRWRAAPSEVRSHPARLRVDAGAGARHRVAAGRPHRAASRCATSRWPTRAPLARCCCWGAPSKIAPIVAWDGKPIGDGKPGPVAKALLALLEEDMRSGDRLIPVPY